MGVGNPAKLLDLWRAGGFILVISKPMRAELEEVLHRPRIIKNYDLNEKEIEGILDLVDVKAEKWERVAGAAGLVRDKKDEMVLGTAIEVGADFLITGDKDLLELAGRKVLGRLKIITVKEYLELW